MPKRDKPTRGTGTEPASGSRYVAGPGTDGPRPPSRWVQYGRGTALAFEFTATVVVGVIVGHSADQYVGTDPWLMIGCTLIGVVGGFIRLVQVVRRLDRNR